MSSNTLGPFPAPLPHGILLAFRDYLSEHNLQTVALSLLPRSKQFYNLFIPIIDYAHLTLDEYSGRKIFWGISGQPSSSPRSPDTDSSQLRKRRKIHSKHERTTHPRPTTETHHSKLDLLRQTRYITITDLGGLQACFEAHEASGEPLFHHVTHLSLRAKIVHILADGYLISSRHLLERFQETFRPKHLCIHAIIPNKEQWIDHLASKKDSGDVQISRNPEEMWMAEEYDDAYDHCVREDLTHFVESCSGVWNSLTSLTIHDLSAQNLPAVESEHTAHRYFFDVGVVDEDSLVKHEDICVMKRSRDIADVISMLGPPDESRFELIDVGCTVCGEGQETVDDLVWRQISQRHVKEVVESQVKFLRRDEVEGCVCCGEK